MFNISDFNPFRHKEPLVAIDIGSSSIKIVEATVNKNHFILSNIAILPLPHSVVQNNIIVEKKICVNTLHAYIQSNGITSAKALTSLPGRAVIIKKIVLPAQGEAELDASIEFAASSIIPETLENVNLDYQVLKYLEDGSSMEVLLVAVKKHIVQSYKETIQEAGLMLTVMDVDCFALRNMYEVCYEPKLDEIIGLVHIGARHTSISVLKNGISIFSDDLHIGGEAFTNCLMQEFKITYEQAEKLKAYELFEEKKNVNLKAILKPICNSLAEKIRSTLSSSGGMFEDKSIQTIYLSGGGGKIPGLIHVLREKLGVFVQFLEPFRGFKIAKSIDNEFLNESAPALAVGAGLIIRNSRSK